MSNNIRADTNFFIIVRFKCYYLFYFTPQSYDNASTQKRENPYHTGGISL